MVAHLMHFSAMYRLRLYRRAFTRYGAKQGRGGVNQQYHSPEGATAAADSTIAYYCVIFRVSIRKEQV